MTRVNIIVELMGVHILVNALVLFYRGITSFSSIYYMYDLPLPLPVYLISVNSISGYGLGL